MAVKEIKMIKGLIKINGSVVIFKKEAIGFDTAMKMKVTIKLYKNTYFIDAFNK